MRRRAEPRLLSVVVPCFNEESVIAATHARLTGVLEGLGVRYEVIYTDDGSRDTTGELLEGIRKADPNVRVVTLARNFGQQAAASAGLHHARGDAVVLIDADLQDPPEVIPSMLERWRDGVDVVYGQRTSRDGESFFKRITSRLFYRLIGLVAEHPLPADTGDFRLMDRSVVQCLTKMPEQDRFLRGMVAWVGFRQEPVRFARAARLAGETKYPVRKLVQLAVDAFISLSRAPVQLLWWLCGGLIVATAASVATTLVVAILGRPSPTLTIIDTLLTVGALNLVGLTVVAEYAARIYRQVRGRPHWIVRQDASSAPSSSAAAAVDFPDVHRVGLAPVHAAVPHRRSGVHADEEDWSVPSRGEDGNGGSFATGIVVFDQRCPGGADWRSLRGLAELLSDGRPEAIANADHDVQFPVGRRIPRRTEVPFGVGP